MTHSGKKVAVIDSGAGGLSILKACVDKMPEHSYVYVSDTKNYPYGTKTESEVIACVSDVVARLLKHHEPDLLVVACNTASTVALPTLRQTFSIPFVGVVPAIKPAAKLCKSGVMGLLATPATVNRPYVDELIKEFAPQHKVLKVGSRELVDIAEKFVNGHPVDKNLVHAEIQQFSHKNCDTVVLGCTHFKLIESFLAEALPGVQHWVDSSASIANRVASLLQVSQTDRQVVAAQGLCLFTSPVENVAAMQQFLKTIGQFKVGNLSA